MEKLSIILPTYKEPYLNKTIDSLLENTGDVEIIPVIDGCELIEPIRKDPRVKPIHLKVNKGMRGAINAGLKVATGKYVMKLDAHCIVGKNFDKIMTDNCADNWITVPRRHGLDADNWKRDDKVFIDYHYLDFPKKSSYGYVISPHPLNKRNGLPIDDIMTFQGSCWMANRKFFMKQVGFLDDNPKTYGNFAGDQLEIGLKYWLNGGENKVIKKTWYAHFAKLRRHYNSGEYVGTYKRTRSIIPQYTWTAKHWINNKEPNMKKPFSWFIEKFWPIKNWSSNWQEKWDSYKL